MTCPNLAIRGDTQCSCSLSKQSSDAVFFPSWLPSKPACPGPGPEATGLPTPWASVLTTKVIEPPHLPYSFTGNKWKKRELESKCYKSEAQSCTNG